MKIKPWLRFFRLPNLPTAPGDALAGAAVGLTLAGGAVRPALAAGGAALFLYMYGLADNDLVGAAGDAQTTPERPIPRGEISRRNAKCARGLCLGLALTVGAVFDLPPAWWMGILILTGTICFYNRTKILLLMGLCRGLSVLCGAAAVVGPDDLFAFRIGGILAVLALGWTLYISAVTRLSEGEEAASPGLGAGRYLLGTAAFVPALALWGLPGGRILLLPLMGCLWTYVRWCAAVAPLGEPHDAATRRQAVGHAIAGLLYLQLGFLLVMPWNRTLVAVAFILWFSARLIRRLAPSISGS